MNILTISLGGVRIYSNYKIQQYHWYHYPTKVYNCKINTAIVGIRHIMKVHTKKRKDDAGTSKETMGSTVNKRILKDI